MKIPQNILIYSDDLLQSKGLGIVFLCCSYSKKYKLEFDCRSLENVRRDV